MRLNGINKTIPVYELALIGQISLGMDNSNRLSGCKFFLRFYFIFREEEGEQHQCVVVSHKHPHWGPGPQPRHVPGLGIELATL